MASLTVENYVKAIYLLEPGADARAVATGQIASALGVLPGTVTSMLKTLDESSLATYTPYEGVRLTTAGRALALRVLRRHRLIEQFLSQTLNLSWDEVHEEAENMEHAVSDRLVDRIDAYLGHPSTDPHGDPIPKADGTIPPGADKSLAECTAGQRFHLARSSDVHEVRFVARGDGRYTAELGPARRGLWEFRVRAERGHEAFVASLRRELGSAP